MDRQRNTGAARRADGSRLWRRAFPLVLVALLSATLPGCQIIIGVMQIFQGFPLDDCDFKKQTNGRRFDEKGKKVAILCLSESTAHAERPSLNADVIAEVTRRFQSQNIKVVDSHKVTNWLDDNGGLDEDSDLAEIGPKFGVDFIVLIKFDECGFREENSRDYFRGRAKGTISVVELKKGATAGKAHAKKIYFHPFEAKYPTNNPVSAAEENADVFQQRFLSQLSQKLAWLFYDHRLEEEM